MERRKNLKVYQQVDTFSVRYVDYMKTPKKVQSNLKVEEWKSVEEHYLTLTYVSTF
jgi:hypothetical protein